MNVVVFTKSDRDGDEKGIYKENNDKIQKPSEALMRAAHTINCISEKHMLTPHTTCRSI